MNTKKLQSVLKEYKNYLEEKGVDVDRVDYERSDFTDKEARGHLLRMILKTEELIEEGRIEKTFRWLGFIQGTLWRMGDFNLKELKDHSRSKEKK